MEREKPVKYCTEYGKYSNIITYKYRGYMYDVEYSNGAMNYTCSPAWMQHRDEQEKIDKLIDSPKIDNVEDAEIGLNLFFDYLDGKGDWA